jgi:hypothetical protein
VMDGGGLGRGIGLWELGAIHFASLRREISMNCLMSLISEGMVAGVGRWGRAGVKAWCGEMRYG